MKWDITRKILVYCVAGGLMIASFILPPTGQIDPSVLMGTSILIMGYELLFGHSIKSVNIDKTGVHIETFNKGE